MLQCLSYQSRFSNAGFEKNIYKLRWGVSFFLLNYFAYDFCNQRTESKTKTTTFYDSILLDFQKISQITKFALILIT